MRLWLIHLPFEKKSHCGTDCCTSTTALTQLYIYIHISIEYIYMFIKVEMIMVNRVIIARAMVQPTR